MTLEILCSQGKWIRKVEAFIEKQEHRIKDKRMQKESGE